MKGAIFDMDGTLLDSMHWWAGAGSGYLRSLGICPRPGLDEQIKTMSLVQAAEMLQNDYGVTASLDQILQEIDRLADHFYSQEVSLKKGAFSLLRELHRRGVRLSVATASNRGPAQAALKRNGVLQLFQSVLTCTETGAGKDQPDIYEQALSSLGTPREQTYVFEDALYAIQTAKKAGFPVVGVYDAYSHKDQEAIRCLADCYINMEEDHLFERYFNHCGF